MHLLLFTINNLISVPTQKRWLSPVAHGIFVLLILADRQGNMTLECVFGTGNKVIWYQHGQYLVCSIPWEYLFF